MLRQVPLILFVALQGVPAVAALVLVLSGNRSITGLAVVSLLSISCAILYLLRRGEVVSFSALFVACYVVLHLLYPFSVLLFDMEFTGANHIGGYAFITIVGLSLFIVAHSLTCRSSLTLRLPQLEARHVSVAFWIFTVPLVVALLLVASHWSSVGNLVAATRLLIKEESSPGLLLATYLLIVGTVGIVLAPLHLKGKPLAWIPYAVLVGLTMITGFLAFRTRSSLILPIASLAVGFWLRGQGPLVSHGPGNAKSPAFRHPAAWKLLLLGAVAVVGLSYVRVARGLFEQRGVAGLVEVDIGEALVYNMRRGDLGFAPVVFDVLAYVPERADYLYGQSYYRLLFTPIPRTIWPDKPPNTQRIVASWLRPGVAQQTTPPGIQGDLYINFGYAGVLGFLAFGWMFGLLDRERGLIRALAVGGGVTPVFHLVRGGFTNPMLLLAVLLAASSIASMVATGRVRLVKRSYRWPASRWLSSESPPRTMNGARREES